MMKMTTKNSIVEKLEHCIKKKKTKKKQKKNFFFYAKGFYFL